jgi:predicted nucleotidyltransferase
MSLNLNGIDEKTKLKIIGILGVLFPDAKVYLYGSRARGNYREWSDIDLALDAGQPLDFFDVCEAKNLFEASNIAYKVDVVDRLSVSKEMREDILKEGVLWNSPKNE